MTLLRYAFIAFFMAAVGGFGGARRASTSRRESSRFNLMTEWFSSSSAAAVRACAITNAPTDCFFDQAFVAGRDAGKDAGVFPGLFRFTGSGGCSHIELCAQYAHITSGNHAFGSSSTHHD